MPCLGVTLSWTDLQPTPPSVRSKCIGCCDWRAGRARVSAMLARDPRLLPSLPTRLQRRLLPLAHTCLPCLFAADQAVQLPCCGAARPCPCLPWTLQPCSQCALGSGRIVRHQRGGQRQMHLSVQDRHGQASAAHQGKDAAAEGGGLKKVEGRKC